MSHVYFSGLKHGDQALSLYIHLIIQLNPLALIALGTKVNCIEIHSGYHGKSSATKKKVHMFFLDSVIKEGTSSPKQGHVLHPKANGPACSVLEQCCRMQRVILNSWLSGYTVLFDSSQLAVSPVGKIWAPIGCIASNPKHLSKANVMQTLQASDQIMFREQI